MEQGARLKRPLVSQSAAFMPPSPSSYDRSRVDTVSTNGSQKLWAQLKSHFFPSELYSQRSETPRDGGCAVTRLCLGAVANTRQWNTHLVECLHSRTHLSSQLQMGTSTNLALGRLKQEGLKYKSSLGQRLRFCLKTTNSTNNNLKNKGVVQRVQSYFNQYITKISQKN